MSLKDDLIAAKALINSPDKWDECSLPNAVLQSINLDPDRWTEARRAILKFLPDHKGLVNFNYDPATSHADVMALLDRAIEAAP